MFLIKILNEILDVWAIISASVFPIFFSLPIPQSSCYVILAIVIHVAEFLFLFSLSFPLSVAQTGKSHLSCFQVHWFFFLQVKSL